MEKPGHELTYKDFLHYPVWNEDPDRDLCSPTTDFKKEVTSIEDFYFKAMFVTPKGQELKGWICGEANRLVAIDTGKNIYFLNKLLPEHCFEHALNISLDIPSLNLPIPKSLFPLKFKTEINMEPFIDWEGVFEV